MRLECQSYFWQTTTRGMNGCGAHSAAEFNLQRASRDEISISPQLSHPPPFYIYLLNLVRRSTAGWHHLLFRMHFLVAQVAAINCTLSGVLHCVVECVVDCKNTKRALASIESAGAFQRVAKKGVVSVENARNANSISSFECALNVGRGMPAGVR